MHAAALTAVGRSVVCLSMMASESLSEFSKKLHNIQHLFNRKIKIIYMQKSKCRLMYLRVH